jgi:NAD(P)H-hydrate epimerase
VRELDRIAVAEHGIPSYTLMTRAAEAALRTLRAHWPRATKLLICCGAGNNAGDGYVLARLAAAAGFTVHVLALVAPAQLRGDAARAFEDAKSAGLVVEHFDAAADQVLRFAPDVIVDALLGIGLDRPLRGDFGRAVALLNSANLPILALDVPTGLHADTGLPLGSAIRATVTITFVGLKQGLFLGVAADYCGALEFADLGVPREAGLALTPTLQRLTTADLRTALPPRTRTAHKGAHGRVLVVGGGPGMSGAIRLAAEAALRAGAGLVYVATQPQSVATVMSGRPEIICHGVGAAEDLDPLLALADAVVVGPGLGRSEWASGLWHRSLETNLPLIVDADALNLLAASPRPRGRWILTPHPGEAARLLGKATADVQLDRLGSVRELAGRYDAVAILKGAGTLIAQAGSERAQVCERGNPGMATAGMGDVLAGVLGALVVQGNDLARAACAGVLLHALAGDAAAVDGERGMLASDLFVQLRRWANPT